MNASTLHPDIHRAPSSAPPEAPVTRPARRSRFSAVWIIPVVAALLGLWLVARHYSAKGPQITVHFETAEGLIAGKTPVLCRSVPVGTVMAIELAEDNKGVEVTLAMDSNAKRLLGDDTQIWIVRARYSSAGISGLNTLVTGNYVELQPGVSRKAVRHFAGLENPPATPPGVPGLRFKLIASQAGGLSAGASIVYKGIIVGKLETRVFHPESGEVEFTAFIADEYAKLVDERTRFYNSGGLDLKVGADGIQLRSGTIESLLSSSVTFTDHAAKELRAKPLADGHEFVLYSSLSDTTKVEFNPSLPYLLLFTGSVRGLSPDAPVEFRGIRVGSVDGASFKYLPGDPERRVPVLIKIDPALLFDRAAKDTATAQSLVAESVGKGLRASLKTGSLLTGQLYVDLDFQKDAALATVTHVEGYDVLPTTASSGIEDLQEKVGALLEKFKALPIEKTVENANETLAAAKSAVSNVDKLTGPGSSLEKTLKNADKITTELAGSKDIGATLHNLRTTSTELNTTVKDLSVQFKKVGQNLAEASDTVKRQPWRLIWPSTKKYDEDSGGARPEPSQKALTPPKSAKKSRATPRPPSRR
jgi:paraquat-inducible protein B